MSIVQIVLWILAFALITAILCGVGLWKSIHREQELMTLLFLKCERKIRKALAGGSSMTGEELQKLLTGTSASLFYSRQKLTIQDPKSFTDTLLKIMLEKGILSIANQGRKIAYRLNRNT